jgi:hypothetical protein
MIPAMWRAGLAFGFSLNISAERWLILPHIPLEYNSSTKAVHPELVVGCGSIRKQYYSCLHHGLGNASFSFYRG